MRKHSIRIQVVCNISEPHAKLYQIVANEYHGNDGHIVSHSIEEVDVLLGSTSAGSND